MLDARRSGDDQRSGTPAELRVEDEEWNSSEVIAVQMAEDNGIDRVRCDSVTLECDERGRSAINQQASSVMYQAEASLEPTTTAERIAGADELERNHLATLPLSGIDRKHQHHEIDRTRFGLHCDGGIDRGLRQREPEISFVRG